MSDIVPIVSKNFLYINDMNVSWASTTTLTVSAGQCRDYSNLFDINLGNYLDANPDLDANTNTTINGAVNGVNGLDTGSLANNTWYYIYVIADQTGYNQPACILSTSSSGPLMPRGDFPSGYSTYRKIGFVLTDGSAHFLKMYVTGNGNRRFHMWDVVMTELSAQGSTSYTALDLTSSVAPTVQEVYLQTLLVANTAGNNYNLRPTGSTSVSNIGTSNPVTTTGIINMIWAECNTSQSIDWKTAEASDDLTVWTAGFVYYL